MLLTRSIRVAAAVALFLGLWLGVANRAAAEHVSITIHAMECYTGVGDAIFQECHDEVESGSYVTDDATGTAVLIVPEEVLAYYLGAYIYCRDLTDDEVLFDGNYSDTGGGAAFAVEEGDEIVCDVYLITPAPKDDGGADGGHDNGSSSGGSSTGGSTTVTTLPSTGSGMASSPDAFYVYILGLVAIASGALGLRLRLSIR